MKQSQTNNNLDYYDYFLKEELITFSLENDGWSSGKDIYGSL
jgi:hypothetical protein